MGKSNTMKQNLTQVALIVFSVVLGLYLSERIEERKNKKAADNILAKIKSEVHDNMTLMEVWGPYHKEILNNLDSLSESEVFIKEFMEDKSVFISKLFTKGTFMSIMPGNDAWEIAKSHPLIVNFDYDQLVILSQVYKQQELTFKPGIEMLNTFNSMDVSTEKKAKANLNLISNHLFELVAREKQLMDFFNEAEKILEFETKKTEATIEN